MAAAGNQLIGIPVDRDGLRVDVLENRLRAGLRPRYVYTVPAFQNPSGAVLSADRGAALIALARHYHFVVVEDDAYGALAFDSAPPTPLGNDAPDVVVTLGTTSKVIAPGLRVGWLRAPSAVAAAVVRTKQAIDLHTSSLTQLIVAELLADSDFLGHHLGRTRLRYAARAAVLEDVLGCDGVSFSSPRGGLFVWAHLLGVDTTALLDAALAHNLMFVPGPAFAVDIAWNEHARISFATLPETTLRTAATELVQLAGLGRDLPTADDPRTCETDDFGRSGIGCWRTTGSFLIATLRMIGWRPRCSGVYSVWRSRGTVVGRCGSSGTRRGYRRVRICGPLSRVRSTSPRGSCCWRLPMRRPRRG